MMPSSLPRPSQLLEEIKTTTSKWIKRKALDLPDFYWQGGYGAFAVSQSNIEVGLTRPRESIALSGLGSSRVRCPGLRRAGARLRPGLTDGPALRA